ncbi:MAG: MoxR family ATPase, partial [Bacteroidota bacterium]
FTALGKAIMHSQNSRSVVLIDEIDKAPRDFPNDLLSEFKDMAFSIKETTPQEVQARLADQAEVHADGSIGLAKPENHPIIILTSNSEKNLPDAFLRRVLYHHIKFPDKRRLHDIITANAPQGLDMDQRLVAAAVDHFVKIREEKGLKKRPATAELLAWIHILHVLRADLETALKASSDQAIKHVVLQSYAMIAKNEADLGKLKTDLGL